MSAIQDVIVNPDPAEWWSAHRGASPIVGTAIHNGHHLRSDLEDLMVLDGDQRRREEDPFTEFFIRDLPNRIVFHRSRFEIDINRARDGAIYHQPEQAWGLKVWKNRLPEPASSTSLQVHDAYYAMLESYLRGLVLQYGAFVLLDIHSYNHRRDGAEAPEMAFDKAPQINIGTSSMDRQRWAPVLDPFMDQLRNFEFRGAHMDVRENIAFQGKGEQTRFVRERFPETGCAIAIEFKKFFMDEWTGEPDIEALTAMREMIRLSLPVLEQSMRGRS
ncbi:N-formylglutamate amidohydrolase [Pararhizobium sp. BT-229]|uniref:N-formylglutamate amidohydrolase n=1 Tax=Pararhizobium sp. BT-229 TaxID=2986923 RepID=UPI0021F6FE61|nr:N-formylglutamate amidohydrolase [Pararhizobium sp. BT-229]MCV9967099.1 N-formylglutamate amidohydrolase [Pararhizobium sp. BT-229]